MNSIQNKLSTTLATLIFSALVANSGWAQDLAPGVVQISTQKAFVERYGSQATAVGAESYELNVGQQKITVKFGAEALMAERASLARAAKSVAADMLVGRKVQADLDTILKRQTALESRELAKNASGSTAGCGLVTTIDVLTTPMITSVFARANARVDIVPSYVEKLAPVGTAWGWVWAYGWQGTNPIGNYSMFNHQSGSVPASYFYTVMGGSGHTFTGCAAAEATASIYDAVGNFCAQPVYVNSVYQPTSYSCQ